MKRGTGSEKYFWKIYSYDVNTKEKIYERSSINYLSGISYQSDYNYASCHS